MSAESACEWEVFSREIKTATPPPKWPDIKSTENLVYAARLVRDHFRRTADSATEQGQPLDAFNKRKYGDPVWYRGEAGREVNRPLRPFVFRPEYYIRDMSGNRSTEKWMNTEFWRRAVLHGVDCPAPHDRLAWLALAQHHGLPTRLLDWTESLLIAAWFAVFDDKAATLKRKLSESTCDMLDLRDTVERLPDPQKAAIYGQLKPECAQRVHGYSRPKPTESVIWALAPALMNLRLNHDGPFFILRPEDPVVADAFTGEDASQGKVFAFWQQSVHMRMNQQHAYFTIHGSDESLEEINNRDPKEPSFLIKLVIAPSARAEILKDLGDLGVSKGSVYWDLDSLSHDVSDRWKRIVESVKQG